MNEHAAAVIVAFLLVLTPVSGVAVVESATADGTEPSELATDGPATGEAGDGDSVGTPTPTPDSGPVTTSADGGGATSSGGGTATSSGGGPGFGSLAAVAALVGIALALPRRG